MTRGRESGEWFMFEWGIGEISDIFNASGFAKESIIRIGFTGFEGF